MRNVVLDTNVLVSGIIALGYSGIILDAARRGEIQLVTSPHLIEEFGEVIARRHIARKYPKAAGEAESLVDFIRAFGKLTAGIPDEQAISPDRDDDYVLACAIEEKADCIVSGDPHLLRLKSYEGIPILTPREFVETMLE